MAKHKSIIIINSPTLNSSQLKIMADIGVALGQLAIGSMIVPFLIPGLDKSKTGMIVLGIIFSTTFFLLSILLVKKVKT